MNFKTLAEIGGYVGMVFLQGISLPVLYGVLLYSARIDIPVYYIAATGFGLILYLIRSIVQKDVLYTISNTIGVIGQSLLMFFVITQ